MLFPRGSHHPVQPLPVDMPVAEYIRCDDDVACSRIEKFRSIVGCDTAAHLQSAGPFPERSFRLLFCRLIVIRVMAVQQNHMAVAQAVAPVHVRIKRRILL